MSGHLKRLQSPKTWKIKRKGIKYISKPSSGTHSMMMSLPMNVLLRDILKYATTNREVKYILKNKNIAVDNRRRKDHKFPVGLFDVLSLDDKEYIRIMLDNKGKLIPIKISKTESKLKPCKITGKTVIKGKIQLNFFDGRCLLIDKNQYKVGDTLLISLGAKISVKEHLSLDKGSLIFLTGGKHIGHTGTVQDIQGSKIIYKTDDKQVVETLKKYAFPVGKDKPIIKVHE